MEGGEGMVAVVRGMRDSSLAVTLLDGSRQYTLMPNSGKPPPPKQTQTAPPPSSPTVRGAPYKHMMSSHSGRRVNVVPVAPSLRHQSSEMSGDAPVRCESGSQATDGRYASMYKMTHCCVTPTSPPVQLTEFPPQRAELCPGQGNFEVGGLGSGENYISNRSNGSFRGAMSWPERGAVCSPRPSREPDAFANSLRKYPNLSMERSTEMVERLITYTQAKNLAKTYQNRYPSPTRQSMESNLVLDRSFSRNTMPRTGSYQKGYEPEVKIRPRMEESPTRDMRSECEYTDYRRMKNDGRCVSLRKSYQQCTSPSFRESFEHNSWAMGQRTPSLLTATNSINMEVQAAAQMVSREVATVPRKEPVKKTVAVPISRTSSSDDQKREGDVSQLAILVSSHKGVGTTSLPVDLSIQTTFRNNPNEEDQCQFRKTKSQETLVDKQLSAEILDLLDRVSVCPNTDREAYDLRREILKQMSEKLQKMSKNWEGKETKDKIGNMLKYVPIWLPCGDVQSYRDAISDEIINKFNRYKNIQQCYRAETQLRMRTENFELEDLLHNVISSMPIKTLDIFGKPVEKNRIIETYVKRVKRLITNISDKTDMEILKSEILVTISKIPIAISTYNKIAYLNKFVDTLMNKLESAYFSKINDRSESKQHTSARENTKKVDTRLKKYVQPTEDELKDYISEELDTFLEKHNLQVGNLKDLETDLIDILIDSIQDIRLGKDDNLANEIMLVLLQTIDNLPENQAKTFTEKILDNVKQIFTSDMANENNSNLTSSQSYILQDTSTNDFRNRVISKGDFEQNLEEYMYQLTQEIDDWLENLRVKIPQTREGGFRQVVVNGLAGDIVDRHKYLELNPSCKGTDEDEIEQLKYQIFKWINKLAGEDNMRTIAKASELMNRIQNIPIPMLSESHQRINNSLAKCDPKSNYHRDTVASNSRAGSYTSQVLLSTNKSNVRSNMNQSLVNNRTDNAASTCCPSSPKPNAPSMNQLNDDYDNFLKNWVQEIPLPCCTEKEKADKIRLGIYNGIWKAVTKLKFDPATFHNQFYYEDILDDEIEELFSMIPKTPEFETRRHLHKVKLIEKTTETNNLIKSASAPASFKQQLVDSVSNSLPQRPKNYDDEDANQPYEELQILKLVEDFILCTKYKEDDKAKANIYRTKLINEVQTLIDGIKKAHGTELKNIDTDTYTNNVLNALQKVPLPDEDTIVDEVEQVLLGHEVEQWVSDLPLVQNNDSSEQLQRKKLKDTLVKKVHEMEKEINISDCSGEKALKQEVSAFLQKVPLEDGESEHISFMVEEFSNRMKNRPRQPPNNSSRKSVAFMDDVGYFEFSQQMPQCSSFNELPNDTSYFIKDGKVVKDSSSMERDFFTYKPAPIQRYEDSVKELASDQFFTMQESTPAPQQRNQMQAQPQRQQSPCCRNASPSPPMQASEAAAEEPASDQFLTMLGDSQPPSQLIRQMQDSPERQQSPCCKNASPEQQTSQNGNLSYSLRPVPTSFSDGQDQYNQENAMPMSIPPQAQGSCCDQGNTNGSRVVSPTRQVAPPTQAMCNPNAMQASQRPPDASFRLPEASIRICNRPGPVQDSPASVKLPETSMHQCNRQGPDQDSPASFRLPETSMHQCNRQGPVQDSPASFRLPEPSIRICNRQGPVQDSPASFKLPETPMHQCNRQGPVQDSPASFRLPEPSIRICHRQGPVQELPASLRPPESSIHPCNRQGTDQDSPTSFKLPETSMHQCNRQGPVQEAPSSFRVPDTSIHQCNIQGPVQDSPVPFRLPERSMHQSIREVTVANAPGSSRALDRSREEVVLDAPGSFRSPERLMNQSIREGMVVNGPGSFRAQERSRDAVIVEGPEEVPILPSNGQMRPNMTRDGSRVVNVEGLPSATSYGEPQGFSTPQQIITQGSPPKPGRKKARNMQRNRRDFARRRLELDDDTEEDLESGEEACPCERMMRYRRRPMCYAYEDFDPDDAMCYPMPYGCPYYY